MVSGLRGPYPDALSLVALLGDRLVGHVLFTPAMIEVAQGSVVGAGPAPLAVLPSLQKQGIGARLVTSGLDHLRRAGTPSVVALGPTRVLFPIQFAAGLMFPDSLSVRGRLGRGFHDPDPERGAAAPRGRDCPLPAGVLGGSLTHPRRIRPWLPESTWKPARNPAR